MMEGARNCVRGYACVQPGEQVVLWTDRSGEAHPDVVEAFGTAVEEAGAEAVLLCSKAVIHRLKQPLQKPVLSAIREADVILSFHGLENAATLHNNDVAQVVFYTPTRNVAVISLTPELLASEWARFPAELVFRIYQKVREQALSSGTDVFRVTDEHGTDFTGRIAYRAGFKFVDPPKQWQFFPGGEMAELPDPPVNGTLVFEQLEGFEGFLKEPIRLTIENQWVTRVEGGEEARWFEDRMKRYENGNFFCELAIGVSPQGPGFRRAQDERHGHDHPQARGLLPLCGGKVGQSGLPSGQRLALGRRRAPAHADDGGGRVDPRGKADGSRRPGGPGVRLPVRPPGRRPGRGVVKGDRLFSIWDNPVRRRQKKLMIHGLRRRPCEGHRN